MEIADIADCYRQLADPFKFCNFFWPHVRFYDKQREVILSCDRDDETFVPAGNMLGKDFVAGFICLRDILIHQEVRVVTTSVRDDHLRVLWAEISRFIQQCRIPLDYKKGGPLIINHRDIRRTDNPISYLRGMVSEKGEGMAGHHAKFTRGVIDEASGVEDMVYTQMGTWAKKILAFGNCNPCSNFFRKAVDGGDIIADGAGIETKTVSVEPDTPIFLQEGVRP